MFHALAGCCADLLIGGTRADRSRHAWRQTFRALEHGAAKNACMHRAIVQQFPKAIEDFANSFVTLQQHRHAADYDPAERFKKSDVEADIDTAEDAIRLFLAEPAGNGAGKSSHGSGGLIPLRAA